MATAQFFCVVERKDVQAEATEGILKNGRPFLRGECACGAKLFKLGTLASLEED